MAPDVTTRSSGFSLTELLLVVSIFAVMAGIAVPTTLNVSEVIRVSGGAREVEQELQTARLKAVQANRTLRVRFNCPSTGQYRRVEFMNAGIDASADRCSEASYPFPSPRDGDPATPAHDGPLRFMPEGLALVVAVPGLEFRPDGRVFQVTTSGGVTPISGSGLGLTFSEGSHSTTVNVNGLGHIQIQ